MSDTSSAISLLQTLLLSCFRENVHILHFFLPSISLLCGNNICSQCVSFWLYENIFEIYISNLNHSLSNSSFPVSVCYYQLRVLLATWGGVFYCIKIKQV